MYAKTWKQAALMGLLMTIVLIMLSIVASQCAGEIRDRGLKNILSDIWEGDSTKTEETK